MLPLSKARLLRDPDHVSVLLKILTIHFHCLRCDSCFVKMMRLARKGDTTYHKPFIFSKLLLYHILSAAYTIHGKSPVGLPYPR